MTLAPSDFDCQELLFQQGGTYRFAA